MCVSFMTHSRNFGCHKRFSSRRVGASACCRRISWCFDGRSSWSSWISGFFAFNNDKRRSENMGRGGGKDFERDRKDEKGKIGPQSALALLAFEVAVAT